MQKQNYRKSQNLNKNLELLNKNLSELKSQLSWFEIENEIQEISDKIVSKQRHIKLLEEKVDFEKKLFYCQEFRLSL